jgi:DNA-binding XRE family transcriptional regulator
MQAQLAAPNVTFYFSSAMYTEKCIIHPSSEEVMAMGWRLKEARARTGVTQIDLARQTGVGLRTIRQIEQTDFEPRLATARKLAAALGVRVEWLVFGIKPMTDTAESEKEPR